MKTEQAIFNSYIIGVNKKLFTEQNENDIKRGIQAELEKPEYQKKLQETAKAVMAKYQAQIEQAKQDGSLDKFLLQIQKEIEAQLKGGIKESYENLEEGLFGRMGSLASGAVKKAGELMSGVNTNKGFRQEAILKHFEKLKTNLGSHLRELERDLETTSGIDTRVKDAVLRTATPRRP